MGTKLIICHLNVNTEKISQSGVTWDMSVHGCIA